MVAGELPAEFILIAAEGPWKGKYVSFTDDGKWIRAYYTALSDAMTLKFVPSGAPIDATWGYCTSAHGVPEQVNLQIGGTTDSVVVSFVTFESSPPTAAPTVTIRPADGATGAAGATVEGVTHKHVTAAKDRVYYIHFVRVASLRPRERYTYSVRSGAVGAVSSQEFSFRAGYAEGRTTIDVYGDMGVYEWNNMGNLLADCANGNAADLVIHMGDHSYNEGESDETRADGYMSAWQPVLANCPWMPIVGNHEYYDGAELQRYLDQTWEKWAPVAGGPVDEAAAATAAGGRSTATTAMGAMLSKASHHGLGVHGSTPSQTSRSVSLPLRAGVFL